MTETLQHLPRQPMPEALMAPQAEALPDNLHFNNLLVEDLRPYVPGHIRAQLPGEEPSLGEVTLWHPLAGEQPTAEEAATIQNGFVRGAAESLSRKSWWEQSAITLRNYSVDPTDAQSALELRQAHKFSVLTPEGVEGEYEVLECGTGPDAELTEAELTSLSEAFTTIDQFSGGAMTADPRRRRIITTSAQMVHPHVPGQGVAGVASKTGTIINIQEVRRLSAEHNIEPGVMIAVTAVHEQLGHQLERMSEEGLGEVFKDHFHYSDERVPGAIVGDKHESITPLDAAKPESKPVREYGEVNSMEDFATSVDAMATATSGLTHKIAHVKRAESDRDNHREDIVLGVMDQVAQNIQEKHGIGTGYVGSPISYETGENGELAVVPGRTLAYSMKTREQVISEETARLTEPYKHVRELVYVVRDMPQL